MQETLLWDVAVTVGATFLQCVKTQHESFIHFDLVSECGTRWYDCAAGTQVAAFTARGHPHALDWPQSKRTSSQTDSNLAASSHEIIVDPQEAESSVSDLLLQVVGTEEGITGLHVDSRQNGGVPFEVVAAALSSAWHALQEQHAKLAPTRAKVSCPPARIVHTV